MPDKYLAKIRNEFPDIKWNKFKYLTHGWDNNVIVLDQKIVFRFPKSDQYLKRFKSELKMMKFLDGKFDLKIPKYEFVSSNKDFGGYQMIKGVEMTASRFKRLNKKQKELIAVQLGKFLTQMHKTPVKFAKKIGYKEEKGGYWWSKENTKNIFSAIQKTLLPRLTKKEVVWIENEFKNYLSLQFPSKITVIHSDFAADHILINPKTGKLEGIIDFSDIELGDAALDFSGLWTYGTELVKQVMDNYDRPKDKDFLERSRFPNRIHMIGNMLEILQGKKIPVTFEESRELLNEVMKNSDTN